MMHQLLPQIFYVIAINVWYLHFVKNNSDSHVMWRSAGLFHPAHNIKLMEGMHLLGNMSVNAWIIIITHRVYHHNNMCIAWLNFYMVTKYSTPATKTGRC